MLWLAFAGLPGGALSTGPLSTGPERAQAAVSGACADATRQAAIAAAIAAQNPTAASKAAAAAARAIYVCWKGYQDGGSPPPSGEPPSDNPPNTTPPKIDPPGEEPTPPEDGSGGHPCEATVSVSYGTSAAAALSRTSAGTALSADPSVATISLDWGDGTSTTQTVAWGSAMTVTHNYYYSTSPYPRLAPGQGSDGDPQGDGSDEYPLQATVLETGARSGYGFVEHVGPFWNNAGGDPPMPGTTSATRPGTTSATRPDSRAWPPSPGASSATSPTLLGPPPLSTTAR